MRSHVDVWELASKLLPDRCVCGGGGGMCGRQVTCKRRRCSAASGMRGTQALLTGRALPCCAIALGCRARKPQGGSLSRLAECLLGAPLDKSLQRSDWGRRPLSRQQRRYAAADAHVLTVMHDVMWAAAGAGGTPPPPQQAAAAPSSGAPQQEGKVAGAPQQEGEVAGAAEGGRGAWLALLGAMDGGLTELPVSAQPRRASEEAAAG